VKEVRIALPKYGISRYYAIAFIHLSSPHGLESARIEENSMLVRARGKDAKKLLSESYLSTKEILKKYAQSRISEGEKDKTMKKAKKILKGRVEVPMSGNERNVFEEIKKELKLKASASIVDLLDKYVSELKLMNDSDIEEEYGRSDGDFSSISIFKPELYEYTRCPFPDELNKSAIAGYDSEKLTLGGFMLRLSGFITSRVGISPIPGADGRVEYVTTLVMPTVEGKIERSEFTTRLEGLRTLGRVPNLISPEGVIIWLSLLLGRGSPDVAYIGMRNPGGQAPASIVYGESLPLNDYMNRAKRFLSKVESDKRNAESIRKALICEFPEKKSLFSKLFLGSQGDEKSALEFVLRVSRKVKGTDPNLIKGKSSREEYFAVRDLLYLSDDLIRSLKADRL